MKADPDPSAVRVRRCPVRPIRMRVPGTSRSGLYLTHPVLHISERGEAMACCIRFAAVKRREAAGRKTGKKRKVSKSEEREKADTASEAGTESSELTETDMNTNFLAEYDLEALLQEVEGTDPLLLELLGGVVAENP